VLEEAAYISADVFKEVVIPLLGVSLTSLIAITTPADSDNYCNELMQLRTSEQEKVFSVYEARGMCQDCVDAGEVQCPHVTLEIPPWKSKAKSKVTEALYGGDSTLMMRELGGAAADDTSAAFGRQMINALFAKERWKIPNSLSDRPSASAAVGGSHCLQLPPRLLFVAVDPNGGGCNSKFAILTLAPYCRNNSSTAANGASAKVSFVMIGIENASVKDRNSAWITLVGHIRALRNRFKDVGVRATIVVAIENCMGMEADHLAFMLRDEPGVFCLKEGKDGRCGVPTTAQNKPDMFTSVHELVVANSLSISDSLVGEKADDSLATLKKQLLAFKRISSVQTNAFSAIKTTYSGKVDGSGKLNTSRLADDLVMALLIGCYWATKLAVKKLERYPYAELPAFN
jgi:hypothetical protein